MWVRLVEKEFGSVPEASGYLRELGFGYDHCEPWYYGETDETWTHPDGRIGSLRQGQYDLKVKVTIGTSKARSEGLADGA
jgi:hypothetical protein